MKYQQIADFDDKAFKRYSGVKRVLFNEMVAVLEHAEPSKRNPGRPSKLSLADQMLLTLQYWRKYRTLFHVAASFGVHDSSAQRIVTQVERRLLDSRRFNLPNRHRARYCCQNGQS